jgi:hypothetical protein
MRTTTQTTTQRRTAHRLVLLVGAAALAAAACGSAGDPATTTPTNTSDGVAAVVESPVTTRPRPSLFGDLPTVELLAPTEVDAGRAPTFEWAPVEAAATYRLSVLAFDAPTWAWLGSATSVRYGGVPEGANGPSLRPGSWWSVTALTSDGSVLAVSDLRAVSPTDDRGPDPLWAAGTSAAVGATGDAGEGDAVDGDATSAAPAPEAATDPGPSAGRACDLLTAAEIHDAVKGDWGEPRLTPLGQTASWCEWTSVNGTLFSVEVGPADQYDPDGWGADETVAGLGDRAYRVNHGWDRRIGFVHGESNVTVTIDYTRVDVAGFLRLAGLIDGRLD